jgi:two-component system nitrate/nitrite response regulator NarL
VLTDALGRSSAEAWEIGLDTMTEVAPGSRKVRVVVADDHPLYREGVVRALRASGQIEVVAETEDGRGALAAVREHCPDVAVLDYKLPELDGIAITHAIVRDGLKTRVLLLSAHTEGGVVYKAVESGAAGYLAKEARREQIVDAVLACARGDNVLSPELSSGLVSEIRLRSRDDSPILSQREREILRLVADGRSLPEIAKQLYLGVTTVKTHVQHLYAKLGVSDRAAAVAEAMRRGLIE